MGKQVQRLAAKTLSPRKAKKPSARLIVLKGRPAEILTPIEVTHLEALVKGFQESEMAWQRMTTPIDDADAWMQVEERRFEERTSDSDRRWKFFSK